MNPNILATNEQTQIPLTTTSDTICFSLGCQLFIVMEPKSGTVALQTMWKLEGSGFQLLVHRPEVARLGWLFWPINAKFF